MLQCLDNLVDIQGIYDLDFANNDGLLENSCNEVQVQLNRTATKAKTEVFSQVINSKNTDFKPTPAVRKT